MRVNEQYRDRDVIVAQQIVMPELDAVGAPKEEAYNFKLAHGANGGLGYGHGEEIVLSDLGYDETVSFQATVVLMPNMGEPKQATKNRQVKTHVEQAKPWPPSDYHYSDRSPSKAGSIIEPSHAGYGGGTAAASGWGGQPARPETPSYTPAAPTNNRPTSGGGLSNQDSQKLIDLVQTVQS